MTKNLHNPAAILPVLAWRLQNVGMRAGPAELAAAAAVLSTEQNWTLEQLKRVLRPIFCTRQEDWPKFDREADSLVVEPEREVPPPLAGTQTKSGPVVTARYRRPESDPWRSVYEWAIAHLARPRTIVVLALAFTLAGLLALDANWLASAGEATIRAVTKLVEIVSDPGIKDIQLADVTDEQTEILVRHLIVASLLATGGVLLAIALRALTLRLPRAAADGPVDEEPVRSDGSVFRVGSLGGPPRPFLSAELASQIAEFFTYRPIDEDSRILDARRSLDRQLRGDLDVLTYVKRKTLPSVVVIVDEAADAALWNTLADELIAALSQRGLTVEVIRYWASPAAPHWNRSDRTLRIEEAVGLVADTEGWTVTIAFGEFRRLSPGDIGLLRSLVQYGPVVAADYQDQRLWGRSQASLAAAGIVTVPATGPAIKRALAHLFAPTQRDWSSRAARRTKEAAEAIMLESEGALSALGPAYLEWATACSLVQPVSLSLADKLRRTHPAIAGDDDALAFSVLADLEGSWVGPEGLRFGVEVRDALRQLVTEIPRERQLAYLAVYTAAFGEEPAGTSANELWHYTRAQMEARSPNSQRALASLSQIYRRGLVDADVLRLFVSELLDEQLVMDRVPVPGAKLPGRSRRLANLARATGVIAAKDEPDDPQASWSIGIPEVRARIGPSDGAGDCLAAFLSGGRRILAVDRGAVDLGAAFHLVDVQRREVEPLHVDVGVTISPREITEVVIFADDDVAILTTSGGQVLRLQISGETSGESAEVKSLIARPLREIGRRTTGRPIVALGGAAKGARRPLLAIADASAGTLEVLSIDGEVAGWTSLSGRSIGALLFSADETLLAGLDDGSVVRCTVASGEVRVESSVETFGGGVAALGQFSYPGGPSNSLLAALENGRLEIDGVSDSGHQSAVAWRPRWLTVFPTRGAALIDNVEVGFSVAVMGDDGEFDIVGVARAGEAPGYAGESLLDSPIDPARDGIAVIAINADRRRVVVRNRGHIEICPLLYDLPEPKLFATPRGPAESVSDDENDGADGDPDPATRSSAQG